MTVLVWDTSPLLHAEKADRLDVLGDYASGRPGRRWRNVVTGPVVKELERNGINADLSWLEHVGVDELDELIAFYRWAQILGVDPKSGANLGEAAVCAWAEVHQAIAVIDDAGARKVVIETGTVSVHGSLWVIAKAVSNGQHNEAAADGFVRSMVNTGMRYPSMPNGFSHWARQNKLLC